MNQSHENSYYQLLVGQALRSVELKDYSWFFLFGDDVSIATESPWRLLNADRIVVTSEDHGHPFGLPSPVDAEERVRAGLLNRKVLAASLAQISSDLIIDFDEGLVLQFLQMSSGYESWRLSAGGHETVCTGGGAVIHF